eukprot:2724076-Lingulodinium_polyedra.AAC.1
MTTGRLAVLGSVATPGSPRLLFGMASKTHPPTLPAGLSSTWHTPGPARPPALAPGSPGSPFLPSTAHGSALAG